MDFNYSAEDEAFRAEVRAWLEANRQSAPPARGPLDDGAEEDWAARVRWHKKLNDGGWGAVHWPREYGGRGATGVSRLVFPGEITRLGPSEPGLGMGIGLLGPTLMHWGNEEQKHRHLPAILRGDEFGCQGYSEPGAGSDLASIKTRAEEDGDYFVVNGQKVWTSVAQFADWIFLLVRTDPDAPKHKGISYLLVDMHSPGITVGPLVQMTGGRGFNGGFFEGVRVPKENLVGDLNAGWQVSIATLMYERVSGGTRHPVERTIGELLDLAKKVDFEGVPARTNPYVRQKL